MGDQENEIKYMIQEYLIEEGILKQKITNPNLDFGYMISFPPGVKNFHKMNVFKPKNKDFIIILIATQISNQHVKALDSLGDKKLRFFTSLRKIFLLKDVYFRIDAGNNRFEISDQIFLKSNGKLSKNSLYKGIRRVFNCAVYANTILGEFCYGKVKDDESDQSRDYTPGSDFSLYS